MIALTHKITPRFDWRKGYMIQSRRVLYSAEAFPQRDKHE
jgi:hypothetical protein